MVGRGRRGAGAGAGRWGRTRTARAGPGARPSGARCGTARAAGLGAAGSDWRGGAGPPAGPAAGSVVVIGIVAYLFDLLMRWVEKVVVPWKGKS